MSGVYERRDRKIHPRQGWSGICLQCGTLDWPERYKRQPEARLTRECRTQDATLLWRIRRPGDRPVPRRTPRRLLADTIFCRRRVSIPWTSPDHWHATEPVSNETQANFISMKR